MVLSPVALPQCLQEVDVGYCKCCFQFRAFCCVCMSFFLFTFFFFCCVRHFVLFCDWWLWFPMRDQLLFPPGSFFSFKKHRKKNEKFTEQRALSCVARVEGGYVVLKQEKSCLEAGSGQPLGPSQPAPTWELRQIPRLAGIMKDSLSSPQKVMHVFPYTAMPLS